MQHNKFYIKTINTFKTPKFHYAHKDVQINLARKNSAHQVSGVLIK